MSKVPTMQDHQVFAAASASTSSSPRSRSLFAMRGNMNAGTVIYWLTVMAGYYLTVLVKALVWTHYHGGYAAHNMYELIGNTLRTTTVDASILLALAFALSMRKREGASDEKLERRASGDISSNGYVAERAPKADVKSLVLSSGEGDRVTAAQR
jgi:hypothetical protein